MTLREARRRTGLALKSDRNIYHRHPIDLLRSVAQSQRETEAKYPTHGIVRRAALKYFRKRHLEIYPRGVTVDGAGTCLDFAVFRRGKIVFVECLTAHRLYPEEISKKRRILEHAQLIFVIEDRPRENFETRDEWLDFREHLSQVARQQETYLCSCKTGSLRRVKALEFPKRQRAFRIRNPTHAHPPSALNQ